MIHTFTEGVEYSHRVEQWFGGDMRGVLLYPATSMAVQCFASIYCKASAATCSMMSYALRYVPADIILTHTSHV